MGVPTALDTQQAVALAMGNLRAVELAMLTRRGTGYVVSMGHGIG